MSASNRFAGVTIQQGSSSWRLRLSGLMALIVAETYSVYATFLAHTLTPVSVFVVDRATRLRLPPGGIGDLRVSFNADGIASVLLMSILVFAMSWYFIYACFPGLAAARLSQTPTLLPSAILVRLPD